MPPQLQLVTPEAAEAWTSSQPGPEQRPVNHSRVERYAALMRAGRWIRPQSEVTFDAAGRLLNGQHRLHAIALAGRPQWLPVQRARKETPA